jgi:hypothetical protein
MEKSVLFALLAIIGTTTGFTINCTFITQSMVGVGQVYVCHSVILENPSNHTITGITGTHLSGKNNDDVTMLSITGSGLSSFLRGATNFFPNIKVVTIIHTIIETLEGDEFDEFGQNLQWLQIMYSNLTTIPSRLLRTNTNLSYLDFDANKIVRVGRDLFTPLDVTKLRTVDFNRNRCIARVANSQTAILALIDELKVSCPFDGEVEPTTTAKPTEATTMVATTTTEPTEVTTTVATTTVTTTPITTTTRYPTCFDGNVEDFVCKLRENIDEVQLDMAKTRDEQQLTNDEMRDDLQLVRNDLTSTKATVDELQEELAAKDQRLDEQEGRLKWLEDEVLRMTTNPCACK